MFGIDDVIGTGLALYGAYQGNKSQKKANNLGAQALAQTTAEADRRVPLQNLGLQQLGHVEAPINLGSVGRNTQNPFSHAPVSNATLMGTGGNTFEAAPVRTTAEQAPITQAANQRQLLTAMASNPALPPQVRQKAQGQLAGLPATPAGFEPAPTTYGWRK